LLWERRKKEDGKIIPNRRLVNETTALLLLLFFEPHFATTKGFPASAEVGVAIVSCVYF
jgi:hypothetical protein